MVEVDRIAQEGRVSVGYGRGPGGERVRFLAGAVDSAPSRAYVLRAAILEPERLPWWELLADMELPVSG
jgi:hypothetical protein